MPTEYIRSFPWASTCTELNGSFYGNTPETDTFFARLTRTRVNQQYKAWNNKNITSYAETRNKNEKKKNEKEEEKKRKNVNVKSL